MQEIHFTVPNYSELWLGVCSFSNFCVIILSYGHALLVRGKQDWCISVRTCCTFCINEWNYVVWKRFFSHLVQTMTFRICKRREIDHCRILNWRINKQRCAGSGSGSILPSKPIRFHAATLIANNPRRTTCSQLSVQDLQPAAIGDARCQEESLECHVQATGAMAQLAILSTASVCPLRSSADSLADTFV